MNSKIWWRDYRNRKYRNPKNLKTETVLRRIFNGVLKEYIDNCSLAGVKQMCDPNNSILQRIVRTCFFCVMFLGMFYFFHYLWNGNISKPLIIVMDSTTYPISNIDFPAVTICNFNRISKMALDDYVHKFQQQDNNRKKDMKVLSNYLLQLGRLIDYSYNKTILNNNLRSFPTNNFGLDNVTEVMKELSPPCDKMLIKCSWLGVAQNCNQLFEVHLTVRGHCCTFNHDNKRLETKEFKVKRQYAAGQTYGLFVILDAMFDDYSYSLYNMQGFEIFISEPTHFGDPTGGRIIHKISQPDLGSFFELHSIKQVATQEVRKYAVKTRKCYFQDELKKQFGGLYSYSQCIMNCRIKAIQSLCKCTPYYYDHARRNDLPICSIQHLRCLNKYVEKLIYLYPKNARNNEGLDEEIQNALRCSHCLPDCELTRHFITQFKVELSRLNKDKALFYPFFKGINMTNKSVLSIYQGKDRGVLNRLDIVSHWYEIISNIGGFCSILVGASILSILEILYFFFFKFFINLYLFYNQ